MISHLQALAKLDPEKARRNILAAYKRAGCIIDVAAEELGVSHKTLTRLFASLGIQGYVDALRAQVSAKLAEARKEKFREYMRERRARLSAERRSAKAAAQAALPVQPRRRRGRPPKTRAAA